jgi:hypothetical protein
MKTQEVYLFDTMMILDHLPNMIPVPIELVVKQVEPTLIFDARPHKMEYIDGNLKMILTWFNSVLPSLDPGRSALRTVEGFKIFIENDKALPLKECPA